MTPTTDELEMALINSQLLSNASAMASMSLRPLSYDIFPASSAGPIDTVMLALGNLLASLAKLF